MTRVAFTDRAHSVVQRAAEMARAMGHPAVGSEHLLLGLLGEPKGDIAADSLRSFGLTMPRVGARMLLVAAPGAGAASEQVVLTPAAERALDLAPTEALSFSRGRVGPEQILLGLLRDPRFGQLLSAYGVDAPLVRRDVLRRLTSDEIVRGA